MKKLKINNDQKIVLTSKTGIKLIPIDSILYFTSEMNYSKIHFKDSTIITIPISLKQVEVQLANCAFIRCHKSYLINTNYLKEVIKNEGRFYIKFSSNIKIPVSRNGIKVIKAKIYEI